MRLVPASGLGLLVMMLPPMISAQLAPAASGIAGSDVAYEHVPVTLDLGENRVARVRAKVRGPRSEIELPLMPAKPKSIRFNDLDGVLAEVKMEDWKS